MRRALAPANLESSSHLEALDLREAFHRFSEASQKLEERYQAITEETHLLRKQLAQKEAEIKRGERLATLGKTAAALAHEIRNPLGAMTLYLSMLKEDLDPESQEFELLIQMERSAEVLNHVVGNILQFSKSEPPQRTPVNIRALLHELVRELRLLEPKVSIEVETESEGYVLGAELGLRQVFQNLLLNAAQAMHGHGSIQLRVTESDECVVVTVSDRGPGISQEVLEHLFEPFVSGKSEGTGLGLAVVHHIVQQHGGSVLGSCSDSGTTFTVSLPRTIREQVK